MIKEGFNLIKKEDIDAMIDLAVNSSNEGKGGPFAAMVFNSDTGEVISMAANSVLYDNNPIAHAEVNAIQQACKILNKPHLRGYSLLTTSEPCPMCMAAISWAYIDEWAYIASTKTARGIGFNDVSFYKAMKNVMEMKKMHLKYIRLYRYENEDAFEKIKNAFKSYKENNKEMY